MAATKSLHWLLAQFLALVFLLSSAQGSGFDSANRAYESGDYEAARKEYQALIRAGKGTANVFYNLGNTEFRAGNPGQAVLGYERALALDPGHPEARRNLVVAREQSGAKVQQGQWYDRVFPAWHVNVFALTAVVAAWVALFAFVLGRANRARGGGLTALAFVSLLVALYAGAGVWHAEQDRSLAIITTKEAVARLAPAEQSGVAGTLPAGSRVKVLSERGDWVYCRLPGAELGWVPASDLERVRIQT